MNRRPGGGAGPRSGDLWRRCFFVVGETYAPGARGYEHLTHNHPGSRKISFFDVLVVLLSGDAFGSRSGGIPLLRETRSLTGRKNDITRKFSW